MGLHRQGWTEVTGLEVGCDPVLTQVRARIAEFAGTSALAVALDSRLVHDHSICGDDAHELIEQLEIDLGVRLGAFVFEHHFPSESEMSSAFKWVMDTLGHSRRIDDLTVEELYHLFRNALATSRLQTP